MVALWPTSLTDELVQALPEGCEVQCYHISTPPTRCLDIYSPTPNRLPERTYSESHSLTVSISSDLAVDEGQVAIFAIELILYTTAKLSTLFVSKADSTGYASLLQFPKSFGSVLQLITRTFVSWLIRSRTRPRQRIVLSLFARAQGQYLFPGSVENEKKHVLDDRGLVKWWCKTLDSIVREYPREVTRSISKPAPDDDTRATRSKAYLIVPGLESHETLAFFPAQARQDPPDCKRWFNDHPLRQLSGNLNAPPRCVIPHFPDDPKSRFLDELDEEISDVPSSQQSKLESPSKRGTGQWKSVKTLEQFWEMMAYRQECSSGRLVGFIWVVFTPPGADDASRPTRRSRSVSPTPTKRKAPAEPPSTPPPRQAKKLRRNEPLAGPILPRAPRVKSADGSHRLNDNRPETTRYYSWLKGTRGTLVLAQKEYDRVHEILLRLDFASLEVATASTLKWIHEASVIAGLGGKDWGVKVMGRKAVVGSISRGGVESAAGAVNVLTVKRKKNTAVESNGHSASAVQLAASLAQTPNVLGNGLIRKKPKPEVPTVIMEPAQEQIPPVNVLGSSLVRKKAKVV